MEESIAHFRNDSSKDVYIIGGGQIYKEAIEKNLVDEMLITHIDQAFEGDTWFPDFNENDWKKEVVLRQEKDEKNAYSFSVWKYIKNSD